MRRCLFLPLRSRAFSIVIIVILFPLTICSAQVVINEVYYDSPGVDDGREFIELYNAGAAPCDLTGCALESLDGASGRASTVWEAPFGLSIEPGALLCVAGALGAPPPVLLLRGVLGNGPDAVRLVRDGQTVDLVGYGDVELPGLCESRPAIDVPAGFSIARRPDGFDTDRNDLDFVAAKPTPGSRNFFSHDLSLSIGTAGVLPCRGSPLSLSMRLTNSGLEPFIGRLSVVAEVRVEGRVVASDSTACDVAVPLSGSDSVFMSLPVPPSTRMDARSYLTSANDENRSNDTACASFGSSPGEVVINEIMYRPRAGAAEWIELEGSGNAPCNLRGWMVCDATRRRRLVASDDLIVPPGRFLILAADSASFAEQYPDCPAVVRRPAGGWPSLNDVDRGDWAETIELVDSAGVLVERISYRDLLGSERGRSIERVSESACSSLGGGIWHRSAARAGATPGTENSIRTESRTWDRSIHISPNPFCPRTAGEAVISGDVGPGETGFLVRIFDLRGIEMRRLFGEDGGARIFSCRWDGRMDNGSRVRTGLYVCLVEFVRTGGGVCRREKRCIVVAAD
jgi:hypothetical protein